MAVCVHAIRFSFFVSKLKNEWPKLKFLVVVST